MLLDLLRFIPEEYNCNKINHGIGGQIVPLGNKIRRKNVGTFISTEIKTITNNRNLEYQILNLLLEKNLKYTDIQRRLGITH